MLKIQKIIKNMQKELKGAEHYISYALEEKAGDHNADIVSAYLKMAQNEIDNADHLHSVVLKVIERHRAEHGEPPEVMKQLWAYEHQEYVEWVAEIKNKLDIAKR